MQGARIDALRTVQIAGDRPATDPRARATATARQFEELFVQMLVENLRKSGDFAGAEGGGLFGDGPGADTYTQWFDNQMAQDLSRNGQFGIADSILRDMERHGEIPPAAAATRRPGGLDVRA